MDGHIHCCIIKSHALCIWDVGQDVPPIGWVWPICCEYTLTLYQDKLLIQLPLQIVCCCALWLMYTGHFNYAGAPSNLVVTNRNSRYIVMSWGQYDASVVEYTVIVRSPDDPLFFRQITVPGTDMEYTVSGLVPATTYECCITVTTTNGDSPFTCGTAITDEDSKCPQGSTKKWVFLA